MSKLQEAKESARKAGLIQLPSTPATPTGTPEQLANLQAVVENAAAKVDAEKKEKKEKFNISDSINTRVAPGQGRQPQRILAGQMPAFLGEFLFASASARVRKSEQELAEIMGKAIADGKMTELLSNTDWQYENIAPDTRTGNQWKNDAPETVFLLPKMNGRQAILAKFEQDWEEAFGKEDETPAS